MLFIEDGLPWKLPSHRQETILFWTDADVLALGHMNALRQWEGPDQPLLTGSSDTKNLRRSRILIKVSGLLLFAR